MVLNLQKCILVFCFAFFRFPNLRLLDFRKIKMAHRKEAAELFKSKNGKEILKEIAKRAKTANSAQAAATAAEAASKGNFILNIFFVQLTFFFTVPGASPADIQKIREAIKKAKSLQEVERLTRLLQSGQISEDMLNLNGISNKSPYIHNSLFEFTDFFLIFKLMQMSA